MSVTIGRHWAGAPGDRQARCDYCGVSWLRSELTRDDSGLMRCPDEGEGLDTTALSNENAASAAEHWRSEREEGGAPPEVTVIGATPLRTVIGGTF